MGLENSRGGGMWGREILGPRERRACIFNEESCRRGNQSAARASSPSHSSARAPPEPPSPPPLPRHPVPRASAPQEGPTRPLRGTPSKDRAGGAEAEGLSAVQDGAGWLRASPAGGGAGGLEPGRGARRRLYRRRVGAGRPPGGGAARASWRGVPLGERGRRWSRPLRASRAGGEAGRARCCVGGTAAGSRLDDLLLHGGVRRAPGGERYQPGRSRRVPSLAARWRHGRCCPAVAAVPRLPSSILEAGHTAGTDAREPRGGPAGGLPAAVLPAAVGDCRPLFRL